MVQLELFLCIKEYASWENFIRENGGLDINQKLKPYNCYYSNGRLTFVSEKVFTKVAIME